MAETYMNNKSSNLLMPGIFLIICITFIVHEVRKKPRILILHSYHSEYSWVSEVNEGIKRIFTDKPYTIRWHYMDTKRHPDEHFIQRATYTAQQVIEQWRPNVVITIADNAQQVVKPYINDPYIKIVYSGVFADPEIYGFDHNAKNVTGIREKWPMDVIKKSIEQIFVTNKRLQRQLKVTHLGDASTTGKIIDNEILDYNWGNNIEIKSHSVDNFSDWKTAVIDINSHSDIAIFSLYHTLYAPPKDPSAKPKVINAAEVMRWTQSKLTKPGIGGWGFFVEHGGMMAIGVSAYEQGEEAARLTSLIIDDKIQPINLPTKQSKQFLIYLRGSLLEQHQVKVPVIYEAFARANNNFYP